MIPEIDDVASRFKRRAEQKEAHEQWSPVPDSLLVARRLGNLGDASTVDLGVSTGSVALARDSTRSASTGAEEGEGEGEEGMDGNGNGNGGRLHDVGRTRKLLRAIRKANPGHSGAWISAARLERNNGSLSKARRIVKQACDKCPQAADVWLEAMRLFPKSEARSYAARACQALPHSPALWAEAARLEHPDVNAQIQRLRSGLEKCPHSELLWKALVELEPPSSAPLLLQHATQCVPHSQDLWLMLARAHAADPSRQHQILAQASARLPHSIALWLALARLCEQNPTLGDLTNTTVLGLQQFFQHQQQKEEEKEREEEDTELNNNQNDHADLWIAFALESLRTGCPRVAEELLRSGVVQPLNKRGFSQLIDRLTGPSFAPKHPDIPSGLMAPTEAERGSLVRMVFEQATRHLRVHAAVWRRALEWERRRGTHRSAPAEFRGMLERALAESAKCHGQPVFWLMLAKHLWIEGRDAAAALQVLERALAQFAESPRACEVVWLAIFKVQRHRSDFCADRLRGIIDAVRATLGTPRIWLQAVAFEREQGNHARMLELIHTAQASGAVESDELARMLVQHHLWIAGDAALAWSALEAARARFPDSLALWILGARMRERESAAKARSVLDTARVKFPASSELWCESVRFEHRCGNPSIASSLLSAGLQQLPHDGQLWALKLELEPAHRRRLTAVDATKSCPSDPFVTAAVAKMFWASRNVNMAREWFRKCTVLDPDFGDAWIFWQRLETLHGTPQQQAELLRAVRDAQPVYGHLWTQIFDHPFNASHSLQDNLLQAAQLINPQDIFATLSFLQK